MGRTVGELSATMTSAELSEWMAYDLVEPFGQVRQDQANRLLAAVLVNANRGDNPPVKIEELLPAWQPPAEPEDLGVRILAAFDRYEAQRKDAALGIRGQAEGSS